MGGYGRKWVVEKWRWEIWSEAFEQLLKKYSIFAGKIDCTDSIINI
jgi:hypothetical protein